VFKRFLSDPRKKLEKEYAKKLEAARDAQRGGDMPLFARLTDEATEIADRLEALKSGS